MDIEEAKCNTCDVSEYETTVFESVDGGFICDDCDRTVTDKCWDDVYG